MSRIGRLPIKIPAGVEIKMQDRKIHVKGSIGELDWEIPDPIVVKEASGELIVERPNEKRRVKALHGTTRAIINNMVTGVSKGFERKLEINGVGYRAAVSGQKLTLELGYSHSIEYELPSEVKANVERNVEITLTSYHKEILGQTASEIRAFRPPEPYKGKGVKYAGEYIVRKVGKKNA